MKNKWILFAVAFVLIVINLLNADFSAYKQLSAVDILPVIVIALVSFLIKTGVLSAAVIGIKKLWQWLRKKKRMLRHPLFVAIPGKMRYNAFKTRRG